MKFIEKGPSIPDELLAAHDEGRVVFFCGSGVSRAKAQFPDFYGLVRAVIDTLKVEPDSEAYRVFEAATKVEEASNTKGLFSPDRIFTLLERQFEISDINNAVASHLRPCDETDLSAHHVLLRLSQGPGAAPKLITTNFDRLFEACESSLDSHLPQRLPNIDGSSSGWGVVHLHGRVNEDCTGADGAGFILSSVEFGHAYLAQGWAREFVRTILDRYVSVFVGYSADDPPVRYLLEGLRRTRTRRVGPFAFQAGPDDEAIANWEEKGVHAISYDRSNGHQALWDTMEAWAERAVDPRAWRQRVLERSMDGPARLAPHERGMFAHLVSTEEGADTLARAKTPPPAEWLCVLDPHMRYANPGPEGPLLYEGPKVDPFTLFHLDDDPPPERDERKPSHQVKVPDDAWDGFAISPVDRNIRRDEQLATLKGAQSRYPATLSSRLSSVGIWITKIASQPAAVWWAAHQAGLHPNIASMIRMQVERRSSEETEPVVREAWRMLTDQWAEGRSLSRDVFELKNRIELDGWSELTLREFEKVCSPELTVKRPYTGPVPPKPDKPPSLSDLVWLDVDYPGALHELSIPDEWLPKAVGMMRRNLQTAVQLESIYHPYLEISPIAPEDDPEGTEYHRTYGLSGYFLFFVALFERLLALDSKAARHEFQAWRAQDVLFERLRIWGASQPALATPAAFVREVAGLSREAFWRDRHERDLLLGLSRRWHELSDAGRKRIERKIQEGPRRRSKQDEVRFRERRAYVVLNRLHWLANQGCSLSFDLEAYSKELRADTPTWTPDDAKQAADGLVGRTGWVDTETHCEMLLDVPVHEIIATAAANQRDYSGGAFVEHRPFTGLSDSHPARALAALTACARKAEYPAWAWEAFLYRDGRKDDPSRLAMTIAYRLARMPEKSLAGISHSATRWFEQKAKDLRSYSPNAYNALWKNFIATFSVDEEAGASGMLRGNRRPEWISEAINSPVGHLADAIMRDGETDGLKRDAGLPSAWKRRAEQLLEMPGDSRRYALALFMRNLSWFCAVDAQWSSTWLLSVIEEPTDDLDTDAAWTGFFWGANTPDQDIYLRLKPRMLEMPAEMLGDERSQESRMLGGMLLAGWGSTLENGARLIADHEMRRALLGGSEQFRSQVLWHLQKWCVESPDRWKLDVVPFFNEVWPRQKKVRTATIAKRLLDFAFSQESDFCEVATAILPHLSKVRDRHLILPAPVRKDHALFRDHPDMVVALLYGVLSNDVTTWPYDIGDTLDRLEELTPDNPKLAELRALWDRCTP